jgi:hypothetical protein
LHEAISLRLHAALASREMSKQSSDEPNQRLCAALRAPSVLYIPVALHHPMRLAPLPLGPFVAHSFVGEMVGEPRLGMTDIIRIAETDDLIIQGIVADDFRGLCSNAHWGAARVNTAAQIVCGPMIVTCVSRATGEPVCALSWIGSGGVPHIRPDGESLAELAASCGELTHSGPTGQFIVRDAASADPPAFHELTTTAIERRCCAQCLRGDVTLKKCAQCLGVRYCCEACQRAQWRRHKTQCRAAAAE